MWPLKRELKTKRLGLGHLPETAELPQRLRR